jgi:hypothetical protein
MIISSIDVDAGSLLFLAPGTPLVPPVFRSYCAVSDMCVR